MLKIAVDLSKLGSSGVALAWERGDPPWRLRDIEDAPEIVGERGQTEPVTHLVQPAHQKRTLVHPLLERAKRVFDRLAALVEDVGALRYAGLHSVQYGLVLKTRNAAELIARALRTDRAVSAGLAKRSIVDLLQATQPGDLRRAQAALLMRGGARIRGIVWEFEPIARTR